MGLSKLDIVRDIYSKSGEDAKKNLEAQSTYSKRIKSDIKRTKNYVKSAEKLIDELKIDELKIDDDITEKKHIIALYESYNRISYIDDKDDVIGIAAASVTARNGVEAHQIAINSLHKNVGILDYEIKRIESTIKDYQYILNLVNRKIAHLTKMIMDIGTMEPVTLEQRLDSLQAKFEECNAMSKMLSLHIDNYVMYYLEFHWDGAIRATNDEFDALVKSLKNILKNLIQNTRINVPQEGMEQVFLNSLRIANIVEFKFEASGQFSYLRQFGSEFQ